MQGVFSEVRAWLRSLASWLQRKGSIPARFSLGEKGGRQMPTYVVLVNWTEQGIKNVKQTIERTDSGGEIAEKHGLKLEQAYWSAGAYEYGHPLRSPRRRSHECPPPGDRLFG